MRVVLGNAVATHAIDAGRIDAWPDGTMVARVAWEQSSANGAGADTVRPGAFVQVEL